MKKARPVAIPAFPGDNSLQQGKVTRVTNLLYSRTEVDGQRLHLILYEAS